MENDQSKSISLEMEFNPEEFMKYVNKLRKESPEKDKYIIELQREIHSLKEKAKTRTDTYNHLWKL